MSDLQNESLLDGELSETKHGRSLPNQSTDLLVVIDDQHSD